MRGALLIRGQWGLGDNIFARPFVRAATVLHDVWLETPWPELYEDLPVRFVRGSRKLRTQMINIDRQPASRWTEAPKGAAVVTVGYGHADLLRRKTITRCIERTLPLRGQPYVLDLPPLGAPPVKSDRPIALVRPVTVRTEWRNLARNPLSKYVSQVARWLCSTHKIVAAADLCPGQEWIEGEPPPSDVSFLSGELNVRELLALTATADVVVGGVGWIVPASIALRTRAFVILGGHGAHNAPEVITDPRMDLSRIGFASPRFFCRCSNMLHSCSKVIPNLADQFNAWSHRVEIAAPGRVAA